MWTDDTYRNRGDDIRRLLAAVSSNEFPGVDRTRVVLMGHSLGGYTVLCVAGARESWALTGRSVKAVVALSPYCRPLLQGQLRQLRAPVMFQGGTLDFGITPVVRKPGGAYAQAKSPKVFVESANAGHLAWTNLREDQRPLINQYVVAFLNHYVKGEPADPILSTELAGITDLMSSTSKK